MRYFIETNPEHAMLIGAEIARWEKDGKITLIEKGDPIDAIRTDLVRISRAFEILKKLGINEDVMKAYIRTKGISLRMIDDVLYHQNDFFKKMGLK